MTGIELLDAASSRAADYLQTSTDPAVKREFALARTHIEDAQMRYTRGLSMAQGHFKPADLEKA